MLRGEGGHGGLTMILFRGKPPVLSFTLPYFSQPQGRTSDERDRHSDAAR